MGRMIFNGDNMMRSGVKEMIRLERREILESLVRQGVRGFDRLKSDCRRFERYWEVCCTGLF